jgi:hypothetical protein
MAEDKTEGQKSDGRGMDELVLMKMLTKVNYAPKLREDNTQPEESPRLPQSEGPIPVKLREESGPREKTVPIEK